MKLWKRASGVLKDKYRIWVAKLSPYEPCRNPELEAVIIKATSHDEQCMDYKNVQKVFQWLRTSPLYLRPVLCVLSMRMQRTRSWVVALKGLMLMHGVYSFDLLMVQRMGNLPFDLSHFSDGHLSPEKGWVFNAFVRSYFAYLDQRLAILRAEEQKLQNKKGNESEEIPLIEELKNLEELQKLIDMLLQIKPKSEMSTRVVLILEAMDCVMDEILEIYGKFSKEVNRVLLRVCDIGGKEEACIGLDIIRKAQLQGDKLTLYFDFCREIGVLNISECPKILRINEEEIEELMRIKNKGEEKAIVRNDYEEFKNGLKTTVITDQWEVFHDDIIVDVQHVPNATNNPFVDESYSIVPYDPVQNYELPDLISL